MGEIAAFFTQRMDAAVRAGIPEDRLILDPASASERPSRTISKSCGAWRSSRPSAGRFWSAPRARASSVRCWRVGGGGHRVAGSSPRPKTGWKDARGASLGRRARRGRPAGPRCRRDDSRRLKPGRRSKANVQHRADLVDVLHPARHRHSADCVCDLPRACFLGAAGRTRCRCSWAWRC